LSILCVPEYRIGPIPPDIFPEEDRKDIQRALPIAHPGNHGEFLTQGGGLELGLGTSRPIKVEHVYTVTSQSYETLQTSIEIYILRAVGIARELLVFIIGQDTTEVHKLQAIQSTVNGMGYRGLIAKDIEDFRIQTLEEKVELLGSLCRFVICENSVASGHIDELKICANNHFVTAILQQIGSGATRMQADYEMDYSFIKTFTYADVKNVDDAVRSTIEWAEQKIRERQEALGRFYPWRR